MDECSNVERTDLTGAVSVAALSGVIARRAVGASVEPTLFTGTKSTRLVFSLMRSIIEKFSSGASQSRLCLKELRRSDDGGEPFCS